MNVGIEIPAGVPSGCGCLYQRTEYSLEYCCLKYDKAVKRYPECRFGAHGSGDVWPTDAVRKQFREAVALECDGCEEFVYLKPGNTGMQG